MPLPPKPSRNSGSLPPMSPATKPEPMISSTASSEAMKAPTSVSPTSSVVTGQTNSPALSAISSLDNSRARLRAVVLALRSQVRNPSIIDGFLSCLSPQTAIDGRLPFTAKRVMTVADKTMCLHNTLAHAILTWGAESRGEPSQPNTHLDLLEAIVKTGFKHYGAYPLERNSAIMVLRTAEEEKKIREERFVKQEKALEAKAKIREDAFDGKDPAEGGLGSGDAQ